MPERMPNKPLPSLIQHPQPFIYQSRFNSSASQEPFTQPRFNPSFSQQTSFPSQPINIKSRPIQQTFPINTQVFGPPKDEYLNPQVKFLLTNPNQYQLLLEILL